MKLGKDVAKGDYVVVGIYPSLHEEEYIPYLEEFRTIFTVDPDRPNVEIIYS